MAMQLGSLYVSLNANSSGLVKGFADAAKAAEKIAKDIKRVSNEVAQASAVMAGLGAMAVKMASSVDGPTKAAMTGLENSTKLLAVQVADMLLPAVREITAAFKTAAGMVAGLDPETKKSISNFAVLAVQLAIAAKALSLVATMGGSALAVLRGIAAIVLTIGVGPILALGVAIAVVAAGIAALHYAFRTNLGGIADMWKKFADWLSSSGAEVFGSLGKFITKWVDKFLGGLREITFGLGLMQAALGNVETSKAFFSVSKSVEDMRQTLAAEGLQGLVTAALDLGKEAGTAFVDEWKRIIESSGIGDMLKKFKGGGTPIALGRGMGAPQADAAPSMDTSSMGAMSFFGAMQAAAAEGEGAMIAIAVSFTAAELDAMAAANSAQRQADAAKAAAASAEKMKRHTDEQAKKVAATFRQVVSSVTGALGEVGSLINTAMSAAASGGPWAALIAVIMEVVAKTASAMEFVGTAMNFVGKLASMIEPLVKPIFDIFTDLLGMLSNILGPIIAAFKPFVDSFVSSIDNLMPVFAALAPLLEALAPIIQSIGSIVDLFTQALKPIFDIIGGAIKAVATVILGIIIGLNEIAAAFGDTKARAEADRLKALIDKMWAPGATELAVAEGQAAGAAFRNAAAQDAAADSAQRVAESLSNVPSGYRLANARYRADMGITSGGGGGGGGGGVGAGGVVINGDVNVTSTADTIGGVATDAAKATARARGQKTGNSRGREVRDDIV